MVTQERVEIELCALKPDSLSKKSSAAIEIQTSRSIFKASCHEAQALRYYFSEISHVDAACPLRSHSRD